MFGGLVDELQQQPTGVLDDEFTAVELESRRLAARRLAVLIAAEANDTAGVDGHRSLQAYVRARTNQSSRVASMDVRRARLCRDFPQVGEALWAGRIGLSQIDELVRLVRNPRAAGRVDAALIDVLVGHAEHLPIREFALVINRCLLWTDPDGAWRDQETSIEHRSANVTAIDGQVHISGSGGDVVTAESLSKIFAHFVEAEFRADCETRRAEHGERASEFPLPRTDAQRRFDALVAIFAQAYNTTAGNSRLPDPVVNIVCDQHTVQNLLAHAALIPNGASFSGETLDVDALSRQQIDALLAEFVRDPNAILTRRCETSSGHVVTGRLVVQALLAGWVRRVVLDANSTVIDFGERKRVFTGNARTAATLLHHTCSHPGCQVPADRSQLDHQHPHADGGLTDQANAAPLCGPHNRFKYQQRWRTRRADNGRTYHIRTDGTLVLFIGERPPIVHTDRNDGDNDLPDQHETRDRPPEMRSDHAA